MSRYSYGGISWDNWEFEYNGYKYTRIDNKYKFYFLSKTGYDHSFFMYNKKFNPIGNKENYIITEDLDIIKNLIDKYLAYKLLKNLE